MQLHKNSNRKSLINVTYGSKKSKNVISQHTNIHMLPIYTYIIHTHTTACAHFKRIALAFAFINTKKKFIFSKMQPCAALQTRKWHDDDVNGNSVRVCIFITHTHKHTDTIHKCTAAAAAHVSHIQRHSQTHTHTYIPSSLTLSHTHTHSLARHSHWHRPQSHLIILY